MKAITIEFKMPFKDQAVPDEWQWGVVGTFNPNVDYQKSAKRIIRDMPRGGPSHVSIKRGDQTLAAWSTDDEYREGYDA